MNNQAATGVAVRRERPEDHDAVRDLVGQAFGGAHVPRLLDLLRSSDAWRDLSFVAESGSQLLGHVCLTRGWLDCPHELVDVLVLSPLSVHPQAQRQGVGSALVREALAACQTVGHGLVFLEGDPAYYSRLGFLPGGEHGFSAPSVRIPPAAFQVAVLHPQDRRVRGALVYPDAFWRADAVGLR